MGNGVRRGAADSLDFKLLGTALESHAITQIFRLPCKASQLRSHREQFRCLSLALRHKAATEQSLGSCNADKMTTKLGLRAVNDIATIL